MFSHSDDAALNLIHKLAELVNNIAFCLVIWKCAKADTTKKSKEM